MWSFGTKELEVFLVPLLYLFPIEKKLVKVFNI